MHLPTYFSLFTNITVNDKNTIGFNKLDIINMEIHVNAHFWEHRMRYVWVICVF